MCGIFAYLSDKNLDDSTQDLVKLKNSLNTYFLLGKNRGPESSNKLVLSNLFLGFHRLAINGLDENSNQPFCIDGIFLICNGEIYNYKELYSSFDISQATTNSDCEVIIHMYKKYGIEYTVENLDGVFAFVLYDSLNKKLIVARDPYGVRPLYIHSSQTELIIASELKQLLNQKGEYYPPGHYSIYSNENENQVVLEKSMKYTSFPFKMNSVNDIRFNIYSFLLNAVKKRTIGTTDRPIACLLSGGLDSSVITAMVNSFLPPGQLETYSIGFSGSVDLKYAKIVADYLKTKHTEIIITEDDYFNAIPEVIYNIESYDTTTIRASIGNYLVAKHISKNSKAKVIFNGDGSDELTGGYLYFNNCKNPVEFDKETKRLLRDIHMYDVLRSDKSISSNGLEPRTPFLDRGFVEYYLSIPANIRCHAFNNKCEKYLLRESIEYANSTLLPREILYRRKEAFSDGISSQDNKTPWYTKININSNDSSLSNEMKDYYLINNPTTNEMKYYRTIFDSYFTNNEIVKYFWMPRYVNATDPSARMLECYS